MGGQRCPVHPDTPLSAFSGEAKAKDQPYADWADLQGNLTAWDSATITQQIINKL